MPLSDFLTLVDDLLRDAAGQLTGLERERAIGLAVARYGEDRPLLVVEDVACDGSNRLPLPAAWVTKKSAVVRLEYPVGEWPVSEIHPEWYGVVPGPAGEEIRLTGAIASGDVVRVTLAVPHVLDANTDTVQVGHHEAVACLAAAILMDQLASLASGNTDSTILADSVEHRSQAQEYAARARTYRARYAELLGVNPQRLRPAGAVVNLSAPDSLGRDRLTHPARHR